MKKPKESGQETLTGANATEVTALLAHVILHQLGNKYEIPVEVWEDFSVKAKNYYLHLRLDEIRNTIIIKLEELKKPVDARTEQV